MKLILLIITSSLLMFWTVGCTMKNQSRKMNESLHIPASKGDLGKIKAEIDGGKNVDSKDIAGQTALMYASGSG